MKNHSLGKFGSIPQSAFPEPDEDTADEYEEVPDEFIDEDGEIDYVGFRNWKKKQQDEADSDEYERRKE